MTTQTRFDFSDTPRSADTLMCPECSAPAHGVDTADCNYIQPGCELRLNLGAGDSKIPGFRAVDIKTGEEVYPLGYIDSSCDEIYASHVLEHFPHGEIQKVVNNWAQKLKPGGILRVAVPDFDKIIDLYIQEVPNLPIEGWIMGGQIDAYDYHKALFNSNLLENYLKSAGLVDIQEFASEHNDCSSLKISLNLEGRKPGSEAILRRINVAQENATSEAPSVVLTDAAREQALKAISEQSVGILTRPRLMFSDTADCNTKISYQLRLPLTTIGGVYWHQSMSELFRQYAENTHLKYVITLDYDSIYTAQNVIDLVSIMERRPEIDAVCAVQAKRECASPLFTVGRHMGISPREVGIPYSTLNQETMPIQTGHFGLTVLRLDKIRTLPTPWFMPVPGDNGHWGAGRMDSDIAFWHQWREAGNTLHLANRVSIGHLQMMVSWPSTSMEVTHQYLSEYVNSKKPPMNVWK